MYSAIGFAALCLYMQQVMYGGSCRTQHASN